MLQSLQRDKIRVTNLKPHLIEATILTGISKGKSVLIPRIPLIPNDCPFQFKRLQFPVRVCHAITINKAQGQTLKIAGVPSLLFTRTIVCCILESQQQQKSSHISTKWKNKKCGLQRGITWRMNEQSGVLIEKMNVID